ncbi:FtsX-like permease family protein [Paenibacillus anaericanus]|uniref:FtsX-like permease family protein n=1 Tax=Paenibacillus anaericanus TaxID=170367 RepID=UPI0014772D16|nr:ABC transporter permease [Paenibacillus anaericanus]
MNFKQFAIKNVTRNGKAYFAYFLSTCISVALFFTFTMFILHPDKGAFKSYIEVSLYAAEIITYFFLFFFVFYSISVFLKSRYKEFGILYMIGTSKKQILKMIFIENMLISIAATVCGILTGLVFSKLFLIMIEKLFRIQALPYYFPIKAILITSVAFILLCVLVSFFTSWIIKEKDILHLLKGTIAPRLAPKPSVLLAILSAVLLLVAYYISFTSNIENLEKIILLVMVMVVIATFFLFSQFSVFFIAFLKKNRLFYLKHTNLIWVSNLFYRMKDNARVFFIISITSTAAFISIGTCYAFWDNTLGNIEERYPLAFTYQTIGENLTVHEEINFIDQQLKEGGFSYTPITIANKSVTDAEEISYTLMKMSVYNQLAEQLDLRTASIQEHETIKVMASAEFGNDINRMTIEGNPIRVTEEIQAKIMQDQASTLYVVADTLYDLIESDEGIQYAFHVEDWSDTYVVYDEYEAKYESNPNGIFLSKSHIFETEKSAYGTIMFLSIFIGMIFFVTSGSFIYNKFFIDVETDKKKYKQLNKVGLTFKEIKRITTIEMGILFMLPYIVACIHSSVALSTLNRIFEIEVGTAAFLIMGSFLILQLLFYVFIRRNYLIEIKNELIID